MHRSIENPPARSSAAPSRIKAAFRYALTLLRECLYLWAGVAGIVLSEAADCVWTMALSLALVIATVGQLHRVELVRVGQGDQMIYRLQYA